MTHPTWQAGSRCLRWLILSCAAMHIGAFSANAQEALKQDEKTKLDAFRAGNAEFSPEMKEICDKASRWYAAKVNEWFQRSGAERGSSWLVNNLMERLGTPAHNSPGASAEFYSKNPKRWPFVDAFGKSLVAALENPATQSGNEVVRINATRMIAEVCRAGYDGAAEVCLKILAKPDENEGVKLFALQGLKNLFYIIPDPSIPEKTIFQKDNTGNLSPLEVRSIQSLIGFILRQPPVLRTEGAAADNGSGDANAPQAVATNPADADAIFYVRREAVRALALVRVQRVTQKGTVVAQPALALLKIARGDGVSPPSVGPQGSDIRALGERCEAVIGFSNLFPPRNDRDMRIDYAVYHVGRAIEDLPPLYKAKSNETSMPWKVTALRLREALTNWNTRSSEMAGIQDAKLIKEMLDIVEIDILKPIEENDPAVQPTVQRLDQWLKELKAKMTSTSLFKNDPKSTINIP